MRKRSLSTCPSRVLYDCYEQTDNVVVIIDIFRATTSITNAFHNGIEAMIPVASLSEIPGYVQQGYLIAAERDAVQLEEADMGNSPHEFSEDRVKGQTIVYSTTNGTKCILAASRSQAVVIGSFLNLSSLSEWLLRFQPQNVLLFCAGRKGKYCLEDMLFAGALAERLLRSNSFSHSCDATQTALWLWEHWKGDLLSAFATCEHAVRLSSMGHREAVSFAAQIDRTDKIPILQGDKLVASLLPPFSALD